MGAAHQERYQVESCKCIRRANVDRVTWGALHNYDRTFCVPGGRRAHNAAYVIVHSFGLRLTPSRPTTPSNSTARSNEYATSIVHDRWGSVVFAEYTLVTGVVVLTAGLALYGLGVPLVEAYYLTKLFILLPVP